MKRNPRPWSERELALFGPVGKRAARSASPSRLWTQAETRKEKLKLRRGGRGLPQSKTLRTEGGRIHFNMNRIEQRLQVALLDESRTEIGQSPTNITPWSGSSINIASGVSPPCTG